MADGPNYEKIFLDGRMHWHIPEHAAMIKRFLAFYESTTNYESLKSMYMSKPGAPETTVTKVTVEEESPAVTHESVAEVTVEEKPKKRGRRKKSFSNEA